MSLSYPPLLFLGLLVAAALIVGAVLAGRRRSAALAAAGVSVAGRRNNQLGLWLSAGSCCWRLPWQDRPLRCRSAGALAP
jgi:Ca-activated chloride channel family protein